MVSLSGLIVMLAWHWRLVKVEVESIATRDGQSVGEECAIDDILMAYSPAHGVEQ